MKKAAAILILIMITSVMITGCAESKIKYDINLGYDFDNVKYNEITFNVYYSDTDNHKWKQIASFPCEPVSGHGYDVRLKGSEGVVNIELRNTKAILERKMFLAISSEVMVEFRIWLRIEQKN